MARTRTALLSVLLLTGSVSAQAGKPAPPPPTSFVPEVIYRYNGNTSVDLRLSNAAGTAAILLHRAPSLNSYDLAPPSQRTASFIEADSTGSRLMVRSWTVDGSGAITVDPARTLLTAPGLSYTDFSPSGDLIAFSQQETGNFSSLKTIDVASGVVTTVATGVFGPFTLRWSSDGTSLYYNTKETINGVGSYAAYRQPLTGGTPTFLFRAANIEPWDISRDGTDGLVFPYSQPGFTQIGMGFWNGSVITALPSITGTQPHYSCGNDRLIYRAYSKTGQAGYVTTRTFATGADTVFSRDQNIPHADFFPC